jgi:hypothetical protein
VLLARRSTRVRSTTKKLRQMRAASRGEMNQLAMMGTTPAVLCLCVEGGARDRRQKGQQRQGHRQQRQQSESWDASWMGLTPPVCTTTPSLALTINPQTKDSKPLDLKEPLAAVLRPTALLPQTESRTHRCKGNQGGARTTAQHQHHQRPVQNQ